jgi:outer membrane receptor for monomeric catechols
LVSRLEPQAITFPYLAVDALTPLGTNSPSGNFTNYHVWSADLTNIRGNHSLRYGGEFRLFRESNYSFANQVRRINFDSTWTNGPLDNSPGAPMGQGMASFLLGIPSSGQITVNPSSADQSTYTAFYLQDDWKVTSRLTVNLGLRYEYESVCRRDWAEGVRATVQAPVDPGLKQEIVCHQRTGRSYEKVYYVDTQGNHSPDNAVCVGRLGTRPWQDGGRNSAGRGNH